MDLARKTCVMYVDYEDLLIHLADYPGLDVETIVTALLTKARRQFCLQRAVVLGDWTLHPKSTVHDQAEVLYRTHLIPNISLEHSLLQNISESLSSGESSDVYLFVGAKPTQQAALERLRSANKEGRFWTLTPPTSSQQGHFAPWELISLPTSRKQARWPQPLMLQAVVLIAASLQQQEQPTDFSLLRLRDQMQQIQAFDGCAAGWLSRALQTHIIIRPHNGDPLAEPLGRLNHSHPITKKALICCERILGTVSALLQTREWVAFSALERALRTCAPLASTQNLRHAWLELLICLKVLQVGQQPQPEGPFTTTTIQLNDSQCLANAIDMLHAQALRYLIVACQSDTVRKQHPWLAALHLLKLLTGPLTHAEARAALSEAYKLGIVQIAKRPGRHPEHPISAITLQCNHPLVRETLSKLNRLIQQISSTPASHFPGISEAFLVEHLTSADQFPEEELWSWLQVLQNAGLFTRLPLPGNREDDDALLMLKQDDLLVHQAQLYEGQLSREGKL